MAKHNEVILYGDILGDPKIIYDENNNPIRASFVMRVVRGMRDTGNGERIRELRYDCPVIETEKPDHVKKIAEYQTHDFVEVKGVIRYKQIKRAFICKNCGERNVILGSKITVHPIFIEKREHIEKEEKAIENLKTNCEISNHVLACGYLCRKPDKFICSNGANIVQYQIAINRKFRIIEDDIDAKTDYPWIKSFGKIAEEDYKSLRKGSMVFVDGCVQTRKIKRELSCEKCGSIMAFGDSIFEVVTYSTEYLKNHNSPEEIAEQEAKRAREELGLPVISKESDVDAIRDIEFERYRRENPIDINENELLKAKPKEDVTKIKKKENNETPIKRKVGRPRKVDNE